MRIHLTSYLLGIGTVVGALTVGFGGGVVLTHTAMKAPPSGTTRVERSVAEAPPAPPSATATQASNTPPATPVRPADSQAVAGQDRAVPNNAIPSSAPTPSQAAAAPPPDPGVARGVTSESQRVRDVAAVPEQAARDPRPVKAEGEELQQREQERADIRSAYAKDLSRRERRRAERHRRYYVVREPVREEIVSNSAEPRPGEFFGGFFGRND